MSRDNVNNHAAIRLTTVLCRFEVIRRLIKVAFGFVQKRQLHVRVWYQETILFDFLLHRHDRLETLFCVQRAVHNAQAHTFQQIPECLVVILVFTAILPCVEEKTNINIYRIISISVAVSDFFSIERTFFFSKVVGIEYATMF